MNTSSKRATKRSGSRDGTVAPQPPLTIMLNPVRQVRWGWEFIIGWLSSRPVKRNWLSALPFTMVATSLLAWSLAPASSTRQAYESAVKYGAAIEDDGLTRLSIRRLVSDFPDDMEYQRLLAEQMLRDGDLVVATRILRRVAAQNSAADSKQRALANLSLTKLSVDTSNQFSLAPIELEERLLQVVEILPQATEAHQLLSVHYLSRGQYVKAEPHVAHAAGEDPSRLFGLSQIQVRIGKREEARTTAATASRLVTARIESGKAAAEEYVLHASLLNSLGQPAAAEKVLTDGLKRDPEKYRVPLARHYTAQARQKLRLSPFYRRQATALLAKAFTVAPGSPAIADVLTQLASDEHGLSEPLSQKLSEHWTRETSKPDATARSLASAAKFRRLSGDVDRAVELLERAAEQDSGYKDLLVEAYHMSGREEEATKLFADLSEEYRGKLVDDPTDEAMRIRMARVLSGVGRLNEAEGILREASTETKRIASELVDVLQRQLSDSENAGKSPDPEQLKDGLRRAPFNGYLLSLMAKYAVHEDQSVATNSRRFIVGLVTDGTMPAGLAYGALGTAALDAKLYDQAEADLVQSARMEPNNPLALNNLAITLIRQDPPNINRALQAVGNALQLLPDHEVLLATKGEVLLEAERWSDAARSLQQAVRLGKNTVEIHQQLATAYRKLGNEELAEQHDRLARDAEE